MAPVDEKIDDIHKHIVPYLYREFPRHLHGPDGQSIVVTSEAEKQAALDAGWTLEPLIEPAAAPAVDVPESGIVAPKPAKAKPDPKAKPEKG